MKPTLELQEIIVALGIDIESFRVWEQRELLKPKIPKAINEQVEELEYELFV
jgi:hypothetical protein